MHPFFAVFRIQCVELSVTWFVLGIYIYEKLRIHENTREFARLYEEGMLMPVISERCFTSMHCLRICFLKTAPKVVSGSSDVLYLFFLLIIVMVYNKT